MLRLLFISEDETKRLTAVTDGIDGQMCVFVTEDVYGDILHFHEMGIVIENGHTYYLGQLKEWASANRMKLIAYPEGLDEDSWIVQDIVSWHYEFSVQPKIMLFSATGETKSFVVTSTKTPYAGGVPAGPSSPVDYLISSDINWMEINKTSTGFDCVVPENPEDVQNTGTVTLVQSGSTEAPIEISAKQDASMVTWNYLINTTVPKLTYAAAGGTQSSPVQSVKIRMLNGNPTTTTMVDYTGVVSGEGFSEGSKPNEAVAASNTGAARTGTLLYQQTEQGTEARKSITIELEQAAGTTP